MSSVLNIVHRHVCLTFHLIFKLHWEQISLIHLSVWISVQCSGPHYLEHNPPQQTFPQKAGDSGVCISAGIALQTSDKRRRIVCRYNWHSVVGEIVGTSFRSSLRDQGTGVCQLAKRTFFFVCIQAATYLSLAPFRFFFMNPLEVGGVLFSLILTM